MRTDGRQYGDRYLSNILCHNHGWLVANTKSLPILGINPDSNRFDGVLLPITPNTFERGLGQVLKGDFSCKKVTMAQASTNDGQSLLAFNDLFVGPSSHTSARYKITISDHSEIQSSSGLIISTGAGSTGWLSSIMNMSNGIQAAFNPKNNPVALQMTWEDDRLAFVVREPFLSKHSQINFTAGIIGHDNKLIVESHMPFNGVIFSDGIESDFLSFNSGCTASISVAKEKAIMVQS